MIVKVLVSFFVSYITFFSLFRIVINISEFVGRVTSPAFPTAVDFAVAATSSFFALKDCFRCYNNLEVTSLVKRYRSSKLLILGHFNYFRIIINS